MAPAGDGISDYEKNIFDKVATNDLNGLKNIFVQHKPKPDIFDENGMTPLQHAAYKGNKEIVQMLLDQGADVNSGQHEHSYTALHFAALSGNAELCQVLLMAGAKSLATNSVGRTASQMAAFVGNHACVATINNYIPKADVDYYTLPQGLETEPKLEPFLANPLHKFAMQVNVNPIRVAINIQKAPLLCEHLESIQRVLKFMSEKEMKRGFETNEVMAFKFHYLSFVVAEIINTRNKQLATQPDKKKVEEASEEKRSDPMELFARKLLKSAEYQESFIRECVREFPYRECTVFRQMVSNLAQKDSPSAISIVDAVINGQRGFTDSGSPTCSTCSEEGASKKCSKCKAVQYCDRECQRLHWFLHKKACMRTSAPLPDTNKSSINQLNVDMETLQAK